MKFFIQAMKYRSPSQNQILNEEYDAFIKSEKMPKSDFVKNLENEKEQFEIWLASFEEDFETRRFTKRHSKSLDDNDNSKFFPIIFKMLLQILPKLDKYFHIHIFETEFGSDLIIGETPTISENFTPYEIMSKQNNVDHLHRNVMHWLPVAYNKVAFMYISNNNIIAKKDRKLRKQDVDILNFYQFNQNPYFYSKTENINIPKELPNDFDWVNYFNFIFEFKNF